MSFTIPSQLSELLEERSKWRELKGKQDLREVEQRVDALELPPGIKVEEREGVIHFISPTPLSDELMSEIRAITTALIPWRKGPFNFFGMEVDAEWRSDFKWDRFKRALPTGSELERKRILDVGCNNGYFMFQLQQLGAKHVLGIDPVPANEVQFKFLKKLAQIDELQYELLGFEHLGEMPKQFDLILSMGVLYHHRHPIEQLQVLRQALRPKGHLILETIVIPGKESVALFPEDRYAKMNNVWFIPTVSCLENMLKRTTFKDVELIHFGKTTVEEQRVSQWCPAPRQSLADFLDPTNDELTIEGYPAPHRAIFKARVI